MTDQAHRPPSRPQRPATRSRAEQIRLVAASVLGGLAVLFAVLNLDRVKVHWIFFVSLTPLIVVILVCILVGVLIGWVTARRR